MVVAVVCIVLISSVSALDFDNSKSKLEKGKAGYDNIRIKNAFGLGTTLWEGELTKNTDTCGISCSAEKTITIYDTGSLIDDVRFETITETDRYEQNIRSYQFYIKTNEEEFDVDDYEYQCVETGKVSGNGTKEQTCSNVKVGSHKENRPLWEKYSLGQEVEAGTYEVKLEGNKKPSRTVDWQIKSEGIWIDDWAVWASGGLLRDLVAYYDFEESAGDLLDKTGRGNDGSVYGTVVRDVGGVVGNAYQFGTGASGAVNVSESGDIDMGVNFTISAWFNWSGDAERNTMALTRYQTDNAWRIEVDDKIEAVVVGNGYNAISTIANEFQHVVLVGNSTNVDLYVNNVFKETKAISLANTDTDMGIGADPYNPSAEFHGLIDEVGLWNRTLTVAEIGDLYNGGNGLTYTSFGGDIILNSPVNNYVSTINSIDFNCSATQVGGATITNISLWTNASGTWDIAQTESEKSYIDDLISYYNLDEGSGDTLDSVDSNDGTVTGSPYSSSGCLIGDCYDFSPNEKSVLNGLESDIDFAKNWSVSYWVKTETTDDVYPVSGPSDAGSGTSAVGSSVNDGAWHHIVGTYTLETKNLSLYLDGNIDASIIDADYGGGFEFRVEGTGTGQIWFTGMNSHVAVSTVQIGERGLDGTNYADYLDEIGFWNRTLTTTEITDLYNGGVGETYDLLDNHVFTESITDPTLWTCSACDSDGDCGFASENRTVSVDAVAPQVTLSPSIYDYHQLGTNLTVNFTITDSNLQACWYNYDGTNLTIPCENNYTSFNITSYSDRDIYFYANDSVGNLNTTLWTWDYKVFANSLIYNPTTYTTSSESFVLNITYDSSTYNLGGHKLIYNGTEFPVSFQGTGNNRLLNSTITIPSPIGTKTFWFNFTIDGAETSTSPNTQSVSDPTPITVSSSTCGTGLTPAFYFDFANAVDREVLNASVNYNFQYGYAGNTSGLLSYGNLTNVFNFSICINETNPSYSVGYGEVQYFQDDYRLRHFYIFENTRLTNTTINNTLYLIPTALTYEFTFLVQDNLVKEQVDKYVSILRWYPEINQYKVVGMGNTDEDGKTVFSLITGTVDYRAGVYEKDGTLIHLTNPSRFVCSASPCTHTITIPSDPTSLFDIYGIQNSLTFNTTSKIFTFVWNDPSQATTGINLSVYRDTYGNNVVVCSEQAETWTGILTCDVSAYTGSLRAVVFRSASPFTEFNSLIAKIGGEISSVAGGKTIGLFLGLVLFVFALLMGIFSPVVAILMGIVSLVPMLYFGAIGRTTFIGIILLGGIIIHFLRRS